ncbi:MAG: hypothetical protein KBT01_00140 [Clostridiales bacterium]|nr:hypothetical protein [Candidatus Blautia equi]
MGKILRRILILLLVFILGVVGTAFLLNSETTDDRSDMNDPVYPEVMIEYGGKSANRMNGYRQIMQADFVRDSVTPIDTTKKLTFLVNPYDAEVYSLSYEIRSSDGSKVIENRKIKSLAASSTYLKAATEITSDLLLSQEYSMQITLDTNKGEIYYYTRLVSRPGLNTEYYVEFVHNFYEMCMDKRTADRLATYLEPVDKGTPTNFATINIHSSLSEISWGSMAPKLTKKGVPVIKDINETTASLEVEYQIVAKNDDGISETYDVKEFYRLKYSETRIRLLDFERATRQVFDPNLPVITNNGIQLGVRDKLVTYMTDEDDSIIAFTQQGDLWTYVPNNGKITRVFSFRRDENGDFRDSRNEHDIKIINVASNGDVDFVLYGYMNRGIHEGYTGICVYHYDCGQNVLEEQVFIPSTESFEFLKTDMGVLSYISPDHCLYLMLAEKLYRVNINAGTYEVLEENIKSTDFAVSEMNAHAAWKITSGDKEGCIRIMNFDTRKTKLLSPPKDASISLLGFMNEDIVYGVVHDEDRLQTGSGQKIDGISVIRIEDFKGNLKKEYKEDGYYMTNVSIGSLLMEFDMYAQVNGKYKYAKKDSIVNNVIAAKRKITIELAQVSRTGTQVRLSIGEKPKTDHVLMEVSKLRSVEEHIIAPDTHIPEANVFYVYAKGGLDRIFTDPAAAILRADEVAGVVLNRRQQYVWERGNKRVSQHINVEDLHQIMLDGVWDPDAMQETLGDKGCVLDLTGCSLDSVLYEVSVQRPVMVRLSAKRTVVIIGYDTYNTYLYHPENGEVEIYGLKDSTALFEKAGNTFLTYIESVNY